MLLRATELGGGQDQGGIHAGVREYRTILGFSSDADDFTYGAQQRAAIERLGQDAHR